MLKALSKVLFFFLISTLFLHCAQVRPPSGGPKDTDPPRIDTTYPANYSTNFTSAEIQIVFNEYIRLTNISDQLIVSPRLAEEPEVSIKKGRIMKIQLPDSLETNSTYTLNFGNSVEDLTEGNKASDLNFVFSTGSYLDSLQVFGTLRNAYTMEPEKDALVMLYDATDTTDLRTGPPLYFTRANAEGQFKMSYLRNTTYRIYALRDNNFNFLYDLPNEQIAFFESIVIPQVEDSAALPVDLYMFEQASEEQFIKQFDFGPIGKMMLITNLPTDSLNFIIDHNQIPRNAFIEEKYTNKDTTVFWLMDTTNNNGVDLFFNDGVLQLDTIKIDRPPATRKDLKLKVRPTIAGTFGPRQRLVLECTRPVFSFNAQHVILLQDDEPIHFELLPLDSIKRHFLVDLEREQGAKYQLVVMPGAFEDIYGQGIDSTSYVFGTREPAYYGNIKLALNIDHSQFQLILQLVNEREELVQEALLTDSIQLYSTNLNPGKYRLRLIYDQNENGEWDTGDLDDSLLPEKVIYFSDEIIVRSGWDLDLEWNVR